MLHKFLRQFLHDERIIQQVGSLIILCVSISYSLNSPLEMAESSAMRRLARYCIALTFRANEKTGVDKLEGRVKVFSDTFNEEYTKRLKSGSNERNSPP